MPGGRDQSRAQEEARAARAALSAHDLAGLFVSGRHFLRNLRGFVTGKNRRTSSCSIPRSASRIPTPSGACRCWSRWRTGAPLRRVRPLRVRVPTALHHDPARASCRTRAIERYPERFDIDMSRCMFCGLCEEACPEEAIVMSPLVEIASFDRASLLFRQGALLVPPKLVQPRIDYLRSDRTSASLEDESSTPGPRALNA